MKMNFMKISFLMLKKEIVILAKISKNLIDINTPSFL